MVLLSPKWAFKVPQVHYGWRCFFAGLLSNLQEKQWTGQKGLCPTVFSLSCGLLNIQPRCLPLSDEEFIQEVPEKWGQSREMKLPVELKSCSFGRLGGKIVAVDYGGFCTINVYKRCDKCKKFPQNSVCIQV
jgi:hypothetical protein